MSDDMEFHADYPHEKGTLYGCQPCEDYCFCGGKGLPCIFCELAKSE